MTNMGSGLETGHQWKMGGIRRKPGIESTVMVNGNFLVLTNVPQLHKTLT